MAEMKGGMRLRLYILPWQSITTHSNRLLVSVIDYNNKIFLSVAIQRGL